MALLRAYCDASFTDATKASGWTAIGGYVGTDQAWQAVEKQWAEHKEIWGLSEFSVSNILAGAPGIGREKAELCIKSFGRIIAKSPLEGVSAALRDDNWEVAYKSDRFPTKYETCLSMLFNIIDEHVSLEFSGEQVDVVLDTDRWPDAALLALHKEWQRESKVIASITLGLRSADPLLECADLCAGTERNVQMAGGWAAAAMTQGQWYATPHAHRHRGVLWSLEMARRIEEAEKKYQTANREAV